MKLSQLAQLNGLLDEYLKEINEKTMKIEDVVAVKRARDLVFNEIRSQIYSISLEHDIEDMEGV